MSSLQWSSDSNIGRLSSLIIAQVSRGDEDVDGFVDRDLLHNGEGERRFLSADLAIDLEIIFRKIIQDALTNKQATSVTDNQDDKLFGILKFALKMAGHPKVTELSGNIAKLPFLILEEIFSSVTILRAEKLWIRLEDLTDEITKPELFSKGQLIVLRICNSLLRKLSKTYNTEFCGRILMFLAAVYPLSEKSALNIQGQVNTNNITSFDSEEDFMLAMSETPSTVSAEAKEMTGDQVEEGEVDINNFTLPRHLPDEETSSRKLQSTWNYNLYKTFWNLQSYFSADSKALDTSEKWTLLQQSLTEVFDLLEAHGSENDGSGDAAEKDLNANSVTDTIKTYFGCKFLTSAKLLGLQLRDPLLRQQLACQILFFMHYLRHRPPTFVEPPPVSATVVSLSSNKTSTKPSTSSRSTANQSQTPAAVVPASKDNRSQTTDKAVTTTTAVGSRAQTTSSASAPTASAPAATVNAALEKFRDEVLAMENKALLIIRSTANGKTLEAMLKNLMYSETRYLRWKANGCPPYERSETMPLDITSYRPSWLADDEDGSPRYRTPRYLGKTNKFKESIKGNEEKKYTFDCDLDTAKEYARLLVDGIPSFQSYAQDYLDAEEEESQGIENTFHPKHDNVYCWRLRRLMSMQRLSAMESMPDGIISKGLIKMGLLKPNHSPGEAQGTSKQTNDETIPPADGGLMVDGSADEMKGGAIVEDRHENESMAKRQRIE